MDFEIDPKLWRAARKLGRHRRYGKGLPVAWFVSDPIRTPDPVSIVRALPQGTGVIYRHFGATGAESVAQSLASIARDRSLILLIGADPGLAADVGAHGVHLPERDARRAGDLKRARPHWIITAAAHSQTAAQAGLRSGADAVFLSAIFPSRSPSAGTPLGPRRLARVARRAPGPVFALGGVDESNAHRLVGAGAAGFAAVEAFARPAGQGAPART